MLSIPERQLVLLVCFLVAPALGISDTVTGIQVSGDVPTICASGDCAAVDLSAGALTLGGGTSGSYNFNATAASGDVYNVSGTFNNTFLSGTFLGFFPPWLWFLQPLRLQTRLSWICFRISVLATTPPVGTGYIMKNSHLCFLRQVALLQARSSTAQTWIRHLNRSERSVPSPDPALLTFSRVRP